MTQVTQTTKILPFPYTNADPIVMEMAIQSLKSENLIILPTDTIYGIAAWAFYPQAEEKIFQVKIRDKRKPIPILISNLSQLNDFGAEYDKKIEKVLQTFWPGALTVVLKCKNGKDEGFRMPNYPSLLTLIEKLGFPIRATSANISGEKVVSSAQEAYDIFAGKVDLILDGGIIKDDQLPSSVVKFEGDNIIIIREGAIAVSEIYRVLESQK